MGNLKNAYALLVGVGNDLPVTVMDAKAIYEFLVDDAVAGYLPENVFLLTEGKATRKGILEAFDALQEKVDRNASVMLYYSGHGGTYSDNTFLREENWKPEEENKKYFHLCPYDYDPVNYESTWIKAEEVKEKLSQLNSRWLIFFLDCCHAAGITKDSPIIGSPAQAPSLSRADGLAQHLDDGRGMSIISSCREDQLSYIMEGDSNSLYTKCMLEVLRGKGKTDFNDPYIRISEVVQYIFKKVPEANPKQNPYANLQIYDDFVLSHIPQNRKEGKMTRAESDASKADAKDTDKELITIFRESEKANSAVLFIHSFSGQGAATFVQIPNFLMEDKRMDGWDMYPVGYSENIVPELGKTVWGSLTDINRNSGFLSTSLKNKYAKYKRIAIVAHSLGGLVAQEAILDLAPEELNKISHVILFGTPSGGLSAKTIQTMNHGELEYLRKDGDFIQSLRRRWNDRFSEGYPFYFKTVAATKDDFIPVSSSLEPFKAADRAFVEGNHFSMVGVEQKHSDSYGLVINALTENKFFNLYSSKEEINIAIGDYNEVIRSLLPRLKNLDNKGLERLIFALEGADRGEEALKIVEDHPLAKENSNLMGVIGGRYKRGYLNSFSASDAQNSIEYYSKGLAIAKSKNDIKQIYYLAINLAFLSFFFKEDEGTMTVFAQEALEAAEKDPFNSLWKLATMGEANIYLGNFAEAEKHYAAAAKMGGIREKISIYNN